MAQLGCECAESIRELEQVAIGVPHRIELVVEQAAALRLATHAVLTREQAAARRPIRDDRDLDAMPRNSYAEFLGGVWKWVSKPYVRWVKSRPVPRRVKRTGQAGRVWTVNERIDRSVLERCRRHADYRPLSLREWAQRRGLQLEEVIAKPELDPALSEAVTKSGIEPA